MIYYILSSKVYTQPDVCSFHAMRVQDPRVSYTTERIALDSFWLYRVENMKFGLWVNTIFPNEEENSFSWTISVFDLKNARIICQT